MARSGLRRLTWISIHAPREGCDACPVTWSAAQRRISIHAPREGCDGPQAALRILVRDFNPRTPRGVRPICYALHCPGHGTFQSTHPARGATDMAWCPSITQKIFQSTHPARGATGSFQRALSFSLRFQSTHPARGATASRSSKRRRRKNFNPRTPRGVRPGASSARATPSAFQSTHPARGATVALPVRAARVVFQSTHPARGATANFTKEQRVCLAQFAYLHKGKKAEHTKTNAPMLH